MFIVIGGRGFLGRHFRDLLRLRGERALVVSRSVDPAASVPDNEIHVDAATFLGPAGAEWMEQATALIHLATTSVPATFMADPWNEIPNNVAPAAEVLLRFASVNPSAKRVLISSGGTVYGNIDCERVDETRPTAPISAYGLGKVMIEEALRFAGRTHGTAHAILRVANPVGIHPRNPEQGIVPVAMASLRNGTPFRLFGDGSAVRDYVDADDIAEAILAAALDHRFPAATWNVGSGVGMSTHDVLAVIEEVSGRRLDILRLPGRPVDVRRIVLDCRRIAADIGWRPRHDLGATIAKLWACP